MIPERFRGAWQRVSLSIDDGPWHEPARVVWVQAGSAFADLRLPLRTARAQHDRVVHLAPEPHPSLSFAGTTSWTEPYLSWNHRLDLYNEAGSDDGSTDVAAVGWDHDRLVAAGTFERCGQRVGYVEVWEPLPGSDGAATALVRADGLGLLVQAGDHAVTVIDDRSRGGWYRACYRTGGAARGWPVALALGSGSEALPGPPPTTLTGGTLTLDAHRWHVLERRASPTSAPPVARPLSRSLLPPPSLPRPSSAAPLPSGPSPQRTYVSMTGPA